MPDTDNRQQIILFDSGIILGDKSLAHLEPAYQEFRTKCIHLNFQRYGHIVLFNRYLITWLISLEQNDQVCA